MTVQGKKRCRGQHCVAIGGHCTPCDRVMRYPIEPQSPRQIVEGMERRLLQGRAVRLILLADSNCTRCGLFIAYAGLIYSLVGPVGEMILYLLWSNDSCTCCFSSPLPKTKDHSLRDLQNRRPSIACTRSQSQSSPSAVLIASLRFSDNRHKTGDWGN